MIPALFIWVLAAFALAQPVDVEKNINDYYQSALQAYLAGDFDQAILLDSKALQANPQDKKAEALLSILVSEKDTSNKTIIWIGGKPSVVEKDQTSPELQAPVTVFKEKTNQGITRPTGDNNKKLSELETRVQTVAFLLERDSFNQYRELNSAQIQTTKRLDDISLSLKEMGSGLKVSSFLFLLALVVAVIALWKSWKNGEDLKKQMRVLHPSSGSEERNRVVNIRR
jgi:hypothetical protein